MMFEFYMAERLRHRWVRLRLYRFPGSVLTDYRVTWSSIAAGFKGLIPSKVKSRPQCCDDDAMIICGCMARLKNNNSDLHDLLVDYYVGGMTFMALARKHGRSDCWIGRMLQKAEGVVEGMLMVLDLRLEMDADCLR
ncbi:YlcG family protein [Escherichia coli]|nr:YlcG family protein [Escherichia coli]KAA2024390.1 YlcG family protein [Escherichia coli]